MTVSVPKLGPRLRKAMLEANKEYWSVLKQSLPASTRTNIRISIRGVSGDVSHGLTTLGLRKAAKASLSEMRKHLEDILAKEIDQAWAR